MTRLSELIAPDHHLLLSPHYDDVALSCGGTAALLAQNRRRPSVAIIFGGEPDTTAGLSEFARFQHGRWGLDHEAAIAARRAEEAAAAALLGVDVEILSFPDAIYRGERYLDDNRLFGEPVVAENDLPSQIVAATNVKLESRDSTRIYAPLAIGGHVDHRHVFNAAIELARGGWSVWFYEDQPYALDEEAVSKRIRDTVEVLASSWVVDVTETWQTKIDAIMAHRSQVPVIFRHIAPKADRAAVNMAMAKSALNRGSGRLVERYWRLLES